MTAVSVATGVERFQLTRYLGVEAKSAGAVGQLQCGLESGKFGVDNNFCP